MAKITLETINDALKDTSWSCLSPVYTNLNTLLTFRCPENHLVEAPWSQMRNKLTCPVCKNNLKKKIVHIKALKKTSSFRTLALDQSSHKTGYAIYDGTTLVSYGVYETNRSTALNRIIDLCDWLQGMITAWCPDLIGLEDVQYNPKSNDNDVEKNHNTFKLLAQVMGAIMITVARNKCNVESVLIPTWRAHCKVKGNKRPDQKRSAQLLVKEWHDVTVTDDESDAICIGKYFADRKHGEAKEGIGEY